MDYEKEPKSKERIEKTSAIKERIPSYGIVFLFISLLILSSTLWIYFKVTSNVQPLFLFLLGFLFFFYYGVTFLQLAELKINEKSVIFYRGYKLKFRINWKKITKIETVWGGKGQFISNSGGIVIHMDKLKFYLGDLDFNQENLRKAFFMIVENSKNHETEILDNVGLLKY